MIMKARVVSNDESLRGVVALLKANKLPYSDLSRERAVIVAYYGTKGELIGSAALEIFGEDSLLRSICVVEEERGRAVGKSIVADMLERSKANHQKRIFLLTETAQHFFQKLGFKTIERGLVPQQVKASSEFASVCPSSAICMMIEIESI